MSRPVGPVVHAISVNGLLIRDMPLDVEIREEFGMHDIIIPRFEFSRTYPNLTTKPLWPVNAPVQVIWGRRPAALMTSYGYVNHWKDDSHSDSGTNVIQIEYTVIGTSKPMNSQRARSWGPVTPTYIAKTIAAERGLRAVLTSTNWVLPFETQAADESDFGYLNRLAVKTGYLFRVSGGTLYFIDPVSVLAGSAGASVPSYRQDRAMTRQDTIRRFQVLQGDNLPGSEIARRSVGGVDQVTGQPVFATASTSQTPVTSRVQTGRVATSYDQAKRLADAWQAHSQFWVHAEAELFGSVALHPGKLVFLGGDAMPGNTAGYWLITAATHLLRRSGTTYAVQDKFVTRVKLVRNATPVPAVKNLNKIRPEFTICTLKSGIWVSTDMSVIYDGMPA